MESQVNAKFESMAREIAGLREAFQSQAKSVQQLLDIIDEKDRIIALLQAEKQKGWVAA